LEEIKKKLENLEIELVIKKGEQEKYELQNLTYMNKLHLYNEVKDTMLDLLNRLSELEETTLNKVYERYEITLEE
jgi:hypothetical protein